MNINISEKTYKQHKRDIDVFKGGICAGIKNPNNDYLEREITKRVVELSAGIFELETRVFTKQAIIPNQIKSEMLKSESNYSEIINAGLPDYPGLNAEAISLESKIDKFNENYGGLKFDTQCKCCISNQNILLKSDKFRISEIKILLANQNIKETKFNKYKSYLVEISEYKKNKELNKIAKLNNISFSKLQDLINQKNIMTGNILKISEIKVYEKVYENNFKISKILDMKKIKFLVDEKINLDKNKKIKAENKILENILKKIKLNKIINENNLYNLNTEKLNGNLNKIKNYEIIKSQLIQQKLKDLNKIISKEEKYISNVNNYTLLRRLEYNEKIMTEISTLTVILEKTDDTLTKNMDKINNLSKLNQTRDHLKEQTREINEKITTYTKESLFLHDYQRCVDKKKGISQSILQKLCEHLNYSCNKILKDIADFEMEISYDSKGILRIYTKEVGVKIPASMSSGYQKFVMDMIMRIVLTTALCNNGSNNISDPNILIVDEGFGCLDKKNFIEVAGILHKLKNNFKCMIVITHIEEMKAYSDNIINIKRIKNESNITYGNIGQHKSSSEIKLLTEMKEFSDRLVESRVELNKNQEIKKEAKKKEKEDIEELRKKKITEKINERKVKEELKKDKEELNKKLEDIMDSDEKRKEYLIHSYKDDEGIDRFKCNICISDKCGIRGSSVDNHVKSKTYRVKHKKYIKSILLKAM
jgi:DNA repair exonuclease SbcCD ATPase subunit